MCEKKRIILVVVSALLSLIVLSACAQTNEPAVQEPVTTPSEELGVVAEGEILPVEERMLAFEKGGILSAVNVEEGDWVQQGTVLAVLGDTAVLDAQKAALNVELLTAQQALDDLDVHADADREQAWQAVLDAQEAVDAAQKADDEFDQDGFEDDIEKAEEDIIDARQAVEDAKDELADYLDLDEENATRKRYQDAVDKAEDTLNEKLRTKTALQSEHDRIESGYAAAEAALIVAQDEYAKRKDGPDADLLAQLQSQVESIQAQLDALDVELAKMSLTAPFDGEVVRVNLAQSEFAAPGQTVIWLADTAQWRVESTDLTEIEAAKLPLGQSVQIEAEAYPGQVFTGTIERISSFPETQLGDVLYTVHITLDAGQELPDLRWGMTLTLSFD